MVEAGDVLSDRYELLETIGRGGMAEVFRARDQRLGRQVAVKVLAAHLLQDAGAVRQLQREARAAAALRHPGLVPVYDTGSDGGAHYIVMELVEGPTLAQVLAAGGPLESSRAVTVISAVAAAVQAAHERGIVHRDLKPSNVLFDADDRVRVTDFGIAHAVTGTSTATATAMLAGSAPYLAPEQARGEEPRPTADVYALGCLLFETLTGRPPFAGPTVVAVIAAHLHQDPPVPSTFRPEIPAALDATVTRAMAKQPAQRQADAGMLAEELSGTADPSRSSAAAATVALPAVARNADVAATARMDQAGDRDAIAPAPRDVGSRGSGASPWRWAVGGAAGALLVAAVAVALTGSDGGGTAVPTPSPTPPPATATATATATAAPPPTSSPSPTAAPPPSPDPPPATPEEAATRVRERIDEARRGFEIAEDDAEELDDRLAAVIEEYRKDKPDKARDKLGDLREKIEEMAEKGDIAGDLRRELQAAVDELAATL